MRPDPATLRLPADRRTHVLDGDRTGGGHRHGTGTPGKTEFPERWDDDTVATHVLSVVESAQRIEYQEWNNRWNVQGERDGVTVTAIVLPDGRVWTAWPEPGGSGVVRNPR